MDINVLLDAFEAGEISGDEFPHRSHVRVAWGLSRRYGAEEGLRRLSAGIQAIAARAGKPTVYHETITRAWFELVRSADDLEEHPELFDKTLLGRYYTPERLAAGRERWLEPDIHPLTLPPPALTEQSGAAFMDVMRHVPVPVAVLATRAQGTVHAATISSLVSVSREPALISVCLATDSRTLELVRSAGVFTVSVLASDQEALADRFANPDRPPGAAQFAGVPHAMQQHGPVLDDSAAWLGCELHAAHDCGDHHIVIGQVEAGHVADRARPLLRHDGSYH
ncbi:MAG TPA: flavin reductase family protein [Gaiellaceae bacterium]|nr:flavin reductase family protein [Gaiellaceae bacterium]